MEIGSVVSGGGALSREELAERVDARVFRKAVEIAEQTAQALIEAVPEAPTTNPPHLGSNVDTRA